MSSEELAAFVSDGIAYREREFWISHIADCDDCRKKIAEIALSQATVPDVEP